MRFKVFHYGDCSKLRSPRVPFPVLSTLCLELSVASDIQLRLPLGPFQVHTPPRRMSPQREDFGSPWATQVTDSLMVTVRNQAASSEVWPSDVAPQGASHGFLGTFQRHMGRNTGTRRLLPGSRTPGFASPGTIPSQCFSHSQGLTPPNPIAAWFNAAATHRFSITGLKELQDKSGESRLWLCLPLVAEARLRTVAS